VTTDDTDAERAFDALVRDLDAAMVVVTTAAEGERSGCLVGFHSQCGIEPRRYAVWLSRINHTFGLAGRAHTFAVHLLDEGDTDLAELFGGRSGDELDKFSRCTWAPGPDGVPMLAGVRAGFVGRRVSFTDVGADHHCLVLDPVNAWRDGDPSRMLTLRGAHGIEAGHPE
jgi:flavin reductase (DIM6/NTAB) family NADH-FMN oxidoreductase RutF